MDCPQLRPRPRHRASSTTGGARRIALLIVLACFCSVAWGQLQFSYLPDLSDSRPLDGARVQQRLIYVHDPGPQALESLECCAWLAGPGAGLGSRGGLLQASAEGIVPLNLAGLPVGSVRQIGRGDAGQQTQGQGQAPDQTQDQARDRAQGDGDTQADDAADQNKPAPQQFTVVADPARGRVKLAVSGPVQVRRRGEVIENLAIKAGPDDDCAITIQGVDEVTIQRLSIEHANNGICAHDVKRLRIRDVKLLSTSRPERGPHCLPGTAFCRNDQERQADPDTRLAVRLFRSPGARIDRLDTTGAASGVMVLESPQTQIYDLVCNDVRGPYPRGQCVQFVSSDSSVLKNFHAKNIREQSHSEDNINAYESDFVQVADGLVDGNWSINGAGVIADQGSDHMHIRSVDVLNTGVAGITVWSNDSSTVGSYFLAEDVRVRDTHCDARDGLRPSSQGLVLGAHPRAENPRFYRIRWFNHCRKELAYCRPGEPCRQAPGGLMELEEEDFTPREPLTLTFPWD